MVVREAQQHANWIDSLMRGVGGDGIRGMDLAGWLRSRPRPDEWRRLQTG